jgi:HTH-type transcriptional regulator/antitoxin HipB
VSEIVTTAKAAERQQRLVELIIDERKARKIRQQGLARQLQQHQSWVSRLEGGKRRIDVLEFLALAEAIGFDPGVALRKIQTAENRNASSVAEVPTPVRTAGYRVSRPKIKATAPLGLNAVGKPFSPQYDPNYRLKHVVSTAHLRFPYLRIKFVGEELREAPRPVFRSKPNSRPKPKLEEGATAALDWKDNTRKSEFTARAPLSIGGSYILSPFLQCWNVDYRKKRGEERQQLGFAHTLDEAKAIAQADSEGGKACNR